MEIIRRYTYPAFAKEKKKYNYQMDSQVSWIFMWHLHPLSLACVSVYVYVKHVCMATENKV